MIVQSSSPRIYVNYIWAYFTDTDNSQDREERKRNIITLLCYFDPLAIVEAFICVHT